MTSPMQFVGPIQLSADPTVGLGAATKQYVDSRMELNPANYGAVADGTTDDTTALQNTINALPANGGAIWLKPGATYRITSALTLKSHLQINGNGATIRQDTTTANALSGVDLLDIRLINLIIKNNTARTGSGIGISLTRSVNNNTMQLAFDGVVVQDFGGDGINVSNPITSTFRNVRAQNNAGNGFSLHGVTGGAAGTSTSLLSCYANGNGQSGYRIEQMTYTSLSGCASDSNGIQYEIITCQGLSLNGCGCESAQNNGASWPGDSFKINGGYGIMINGCWTYKPLTTSVWVTGSAKAVTIGAFAENTPQAGATACVKVDAGCLVSAIGVSNVTANSYATGTTSMLNDGGGISIPGYFYGASTGYFEGAVGCTTSPTAVQHLTRKDYVDTKMPGNYLLYLGGSGNWSENTRTGAFMSTLPMWLATSSTTAQSTTQGLTLTLLFPVGLDANCTRNFTGFDLYAATAPTATQTMTFAVYTGASASSLTRVGSNSTFSITTGMTNTFLNIPFPSQVALTAGTPTFIAVQASMSLPSTGSGVKFACSPGTSVGLINKGGKFGEWVVGTGATTPGATLNASADVASTTAGSLVWSGLY